MALTKITYCSWEGSPALLAHYDDGRILGFEYLGEKWRDSHGADVATKAAVIEKADFDKAFPDVGLPAFPE